MENLTERILLVGAAGQLGRELAAVFADTRVFAPPRADLDVEVESAVANALRAVRPTLVVNTAAYHHVERCEAYPERAFAVNAMAVDRLACACTLVGAAFATFSTDYVFDGTATRPYREDDATGPLCAYGASKLAGEHLTRRHGERHFIVRTSGLYGRAPSSVKGYTFVDRILAQAEANERIRVVDDITFSPSYARDVARGFRRIVERAGFGTYHLTNGGATTWHGFATTAIALRGLNPTDFQPVSQADFPSTVRRPPYSALEGAALVTAGIEPMPPWEDGLRDYIAARP
ncbi:MAG: dTDP-4-dehydrorhamnose reductase [Candidatus Baltobacteraceae bacterium]